MKNHRWAQVDIVRTLAPIECSVMADSVACQKYELTNYL